MLGRIRARWDIHGSAISIERLRNLLTLIDAYWLIDCPTYQRIFAIHGLIEKSIHGLIELISRIRDNESSCGRFTVSFDKSGRCFQQPWDMSCIYENYYTGLGKCPKRDFEHHLQISVGDYITNSWVMFNWDIYQPLLHQIVSGSVWDVVERVKLGPPKPTSLAHAPFDLSKQATILGGRPKTGDFCALRSDDIRWYQMYISCSGKLIAKLFQILCGSFGCSLNAAWFVRLDDRTLP